jgi:plasmid stabilization system protein ParE
MNVRWLPPALDDIRRLYDFLLDKDPAAAGRAARAIRTGADRLVGSPEIGRPLADGTGRRELVIPFGAGAFVLRYRIRDDTVVVIRVWHGREAR